MIQNYILFFAVLALSQTYAIDIFRTGRVSFTDSWDQRELCHDALEIEISDSSAPITFCRDLQFPAGVSSRINGVKSNSTKFDFFHGRSKSSSTANCISNHSTGEITTCSIIDEIEGMVYQISRDDNGDLTTTASHSSEFPPEAEPEHKSRRRLGEKENIFIHKKDNDNDRDLAEDGSELGILVTWTKTAECKRSGLDDSCTLTETTKENMLAMIHLAVAETNVAFDLSGVKTNLKLVHAYRVETDGPELAMTDAIVSLRDTSDGVYDDVHEKREQYGADLVSMIHSDTTHCGIGISGPRKRDMFSVTSFLCATGNFSFGHEIGHNLGSNHDRGTSKKCEEDGTYNYGFRDPNANFRSIMAYGCQTGECDGNSGAGNCIRVQRFSNSMMQYKSQSIGNASNDNARKINDVIAEVSNYYCEDCPPTPSPSATPASSFLWDIFSRVSGMFCDDD
jgi:hypothetical protein